MVTPIKNPWETPEGKTIWQSEAKYWEWLRGALRRLWADYPLRKEWKKRQLRPLTQEEKQSGKFHSSTKNIGQCVFCEEWFAGSKLECDHKGDSKSCNTKETAEEFLWHCGGLTGDFFQLVCKPCHKIRNHAQKTGTSFEEALIEKQTIAIIKSKKDKQWLEERGITPHKNTKQRRQQIKETLENEFNHSKL